MARRNARAGKKVQAARAESSPNVTIPSVRFFVDSVQDRQGARLERDLYASGQDARKRKRASRARVIMQRTTQGPCGPAIRYIS